MAKKNQSIVKILDTYIVSRNLTWFARIKAALMLIAINFLLTILFELLHIGYLYGSKSSGEANSYLAQPELFLVSLFTVTLFAALLEEFLFRFIPYKISAKLSHKYFWHIGIISSLLFAYIHDPTMFTKFDGLPLPQLILGLFLWRYIPSGFRNVFWIHYFFNVFVVLSFYAITYSTNIFK